MIYCLERDCDVVGMVGLVSVLGVILVVLGCLLLVWAGVTVIEVEQAVREQPGVYRVAIGPPIAVFFGLGFIAVGAWRLYLESGRK